MSNEQFKSFALILAVLPFIVVIIILISDSVKYGGGGFSNAGDLNPNKK